MNKYLHIGITVSVLLLSQIAYYFAYKSNVITLGCEVPQPSCSNPYMGLFDVFKSLLQLVLASVWTYLAHSVVKSALAFSISFFWVFSVWNEFADYLWGDQYFFKIDEGINFIIGLTVCSILYLIWRKKLRQH